MCATNTAMAASKWWIIPPAIFIFIEPGIPHEVFNLSDSEPVVAFVARSTADEWDKIIPYDR